jgi:hypothetical protein
VPVQVHPRSWPPLQPLAANVQLLPPGELQRYVLLSSPQAVAPQFAVTGVPPGPSPEQLQSEWPQTFGVPAPPQVSGDTQLSGQVPPQPSLPPHRPVQLGVQHPLSANDQLPPPGELQRYVLLSEPQAVLPHAAETGTSPGPVPSQLQLLVISGTPPSVAPQPVDESDQLLPPGELQRYVLLSEPQAVLPHAAEMGASPGPVPSQLQPLAMSGVPPSVVPQPLAENVQLSSPPGELQR